MSFRLLVVDDEPDMESLCRQKFRGAVRRGELQIRFVSNGLQALDALAQEPDTDLVLTDLNMPEMDGLALLGRIQALRLPLRTVVVSAYGDMAHIRQAMNRGAFDFLTKPIEFADLDATVAKALGVVAEVKAGIEARRRMQVAEERHRFVREVFGRYVPDQVVAELLESPHGLRLGGQRREITTMMVDVRGFSALSEQLQPEAVVDLLNRFFAVAVACIHRHGGTVNEILGDGLLVFFGAPVAQENSALAAVAAALDLQLAMQDFRREAPVEGASGLAVGVGIHTAQAVVGNIGSEQRAKYTAVGSGVNLACRIESCTLGGQVLLSDATLVKAGVSVCARRWGDVHAKGFRDKVVLHELLGLAGPPALRMPARSTDHGCLPCRLGASVYPVEGAVVSERALQGECIRLSERLAIIESRQCPASGTSVQLVLSDAQGRRRGGVCHGKVDTDAISCEDRFVIHFSYADPVFLQTVEDLLRGVDEVERRRRADPKACADRLWCRACEDRHGP
ncbi:MAG: response regulator [Xanthomonadales bacterium]|nr:Regulator of RpoS [Xanthomonadales bacterium]MCC6593753.1 response regulator [Xanthomonadales bacterium]